MSAQSVKSKSAKIMSKAPSNKDDEAESILDPSNRGVTYLL